MRTLKMIQRIALLGSLAMLLTFRLFVAQSRDQLPQKVAPTLRLNVDLVSLNVVVTDAKGRPMPDLDKENFRVYENRVEQPISFFSHEEAPVSWGLVLDRSRSMSSVIRDVHQAALHLIDEGTGQDETFVLSFNDETQMVQDFTSDRNRLANALFDLQSSGETALYDAVAFALERLQEGRHTKRALMVTDGEDNSRELAFDELVELAAERDVLIYVIGIGEPPDPRQRGLKGWEPRGQLEKLASATGGTAFFPVGIKRCQDAVKKIALEVSHQYNIGYYPSKLVSGGKWRKLKVVVVRQGQPDQRYVARTRTRYFAAQY